MRSDVRTTQERDFKKMLDTRIYRVLVFTPPVFTYYLLAYCFLPCVIHLISLLTESYVPRPWSLPR